MDPKIGLWIKISGQSRLTTEPPSVHTAPSALGLGAGAGVGRPQPKSITDAGMELPI